MYVLRQGRRTGIAPGILVRVESVGTRSCSSGVAPPDNTATLIVDKSGKRDLIAQRSFSHFQEPFAPIGELVDEEFQDFGPRIAIGVPS
jgi:hypothetical protein